MPRLSRPSAVLLVLASVGLAIIGCRRRSAPTDSLTSPADASPDARRAAAPVDARAAQLSADSSVSTQRATCRRGPAVEPWRYSPSVTELSDGRVLVAGGRQHDAFGFLRDTRIWDPATDTIATTSKLAEARAMHGAVRLANGKVVLAGGTAAAIEVFDPATRAFRTVGKMTTTVARPTMIALPDGSALIAGGDRLYKHALSEDVYVVDATGTKSRRGTPLPEGRAEDIAELTGENLRLYGGMTHGELAPVATAIVAPWRTLAWTTEPTSVGVRTAARSHASVPKDKTLTVIGALASGDLLGMTNTSLYRFDPKLGWREAGGFREDRTAAEAAVLSNGDVVVVGGLEEAAAPIEVCRFGANDAPRRD